MYGLCKIGFGQFSIDSTTTTNDLIIINTSSWQSTNRLGACFQYWEEWSSDFAEALDETPIEIDKLNE